MIVAPIVAHAFAYYKNCRSDAPEVSFKKVITSEKNFNIGVLLCIGCYSEIS